MKDLKKKEELLNLEPLKIEEEVIYGGFSDVLEVGFAYENSATTNQCTNHCTTNDKFGCGIIVNVNCSNCKCPKTEGPTVG
jgi:hypothetical protein